MSYDFSGCESLISKYAPMLMLVGEKEERPLNRLIGAYRPEIHRATVSKMKRLRSQGITVGEIARACRVSYSTTIKYTSRSSMSEREPHKLRVAG